MRETLALNFAIHDAELPENHFRGLASVFHTLIDAWVPTRILPGAFTKTLQENAHRIKVLYQHNPDWPIGVPTKMEENTDGLLVEARVSQTTMGKDTLILMKDKVITELSIGFDPIKHEMVEEGGLGMVRHVKEVRLWEFSPVTFAANRDARIGAVNSLNHMIERLSREDYTELVKRVLTANLPDELQSAMLSLVTQHEQFAGKVLSAKNKQLVNDAIAALQALLSSAEPDDDENQSDPLTDAIIADRARELSLMSLRLGLR